VGAQLAGSSSGDEKIVQSLAIGASYTYISRSVDNISSAPLVISFGVASVPQKVFSSPYKNGEPLPIGSNQPVLITKNIIAPILLVSYRFGGF
jgi:hypothetical protein